MHHTGGFDFKESLPNLRAVTLRVIAVCLTNS